jgi:hypothetical protein
MPNPDTAAAVYRRFDRRGKPGVREVPRCTEVAEVAAHYGENP